MSEAVSSTTLLRKLLAGAAAIGFGLAIAWWCFAGSDPRDFPGLSRIDNFDDGQISLTYGELAHHGRYSVIQRGVRDHVLRVGGREVPLAISDGERFSSRRLVLETSNAVTHLLGDAITTISTDGTLDRALLAAPELVSPAAAHKILDAVVSEQSLTVLLKSSFHPQQDPTRDDDTSNFPRTFRVTYTLGSRSHRSATTELPSILPIAEEELLPCSDARFRCEDASKWALLLPTDWRLRGAIDGPGHLLVLETRDPVVPTRESVPIPDSIESRWIFSTENDDVWLASQRGSSVAYRCDASSNNTAWQAVEFDLPPGVPNADVALMAISDGRALLWSRSPGWRSLLGYSYGTLRECVFLCDSASGRRIATHELHQSALRGLPSPQYMRVSFSADASEVLVATRNNEVLTINIAAWITECDEGSE